jgi:hypothetical protein
LHAILFGSSENPIVPGEIPRVDVERKGIKRGKNRMKIK